MSRVFVHGVGAVSPAGWGCEALCDALDRNEPVGEVDLPRPGWEEPLRIRSVPPAKPPPAFLNHPRLRRAGVASQHTVAAALEALGELAAPNQSSAPRLGIIVCLLTGVVAYSRRFYQEVLRDPVSASPVIFPETVFNAPASHLGAYLGATSCNYTLVGDDGVFLQGLALAAQWLNDDQADACVVVGAEELDWLVPDALRLFCRGAIHGAGAGAVMLSKKEAGAIAELAAVTDSFAFGRCEPRRSAARKMRDQLPAAAADELLCASARNIPRYDADESAAWSDWSGPRLVPKSVLGEGFVASAAWQCVAGCDALRRGRAAAANVSVVGVSQQAIGARFEAV